MKSLQIIVPLALLGIGLMAGSFHGKYVQKRDMQKEAIQAGVAYYHPKTKAFTWDKYNLMIVDKIEELLPKNVGGVPIPQVKPEEKR